MAKLILAMAQETGHFNATLALAKTLRGRGHEVRYLAMPDRAAPLEQQGFETIPIMEEYFPRGAPSSGQPAGSRFALSFWTERRRGIVRARAAFDALVERELDQILTRHQPDLCLVDPLFPAVAVVTERANVRTLMLSTTLPLARIRGIAPLCTDIAPTGDWLGHARAASAWTQLLVKQAFLRGLARLGLRFDRELTLLRAAKRRGFPQSRIQRAAFYASRVELPELILCPREFDFRSPEVDPTRHYVGPVIDLQRHEPSFPWQRIAPDKPLVYCSLGSAPHQWPHFPRFLSSVLAAARQRTDWQWVISTGESAYQDALQRAPSEAVVVPYAPQLGLLSRASVMVTHAGLNSLKEALWHAVPLAALPCMLDQKGNAARIAYHGLGAVEDISRLDGERLIGCISLVLGDSLVRKRLEAMQQCFKQNEDSGAGVTLIEEHLRTPIGSARPRQ